MTFLLKPFIPFIELNKLINLFLNVDKKRLKMLEMHLKALFIRSIMDFTISQHKPFWEKVLIRGAKTSAEDKSEGQTGQ